MPTLTIDGQEITVEPGTTVLKAAQQLGIDIPHLCYHPYLQIAGCCRLCLVDIEKMGKPQISCATIANDGMVVRTDSEDILRHRKNVFEFHVKNHPLDCPVCDQAGECVLQDYYMKLGLYQSRLQDAKLHKPKRVDIGCGVIRDSERCIQCSRCVRFCAEVTGTHEMVLFNRGDHTEIGTFPGQNLNNDYAQCLTDVCPVGALTSNDFRFQCRVWFLQSTPSVCPGCSTGCNIYIHHHQGVAYRIKPRVNEEVNGPWMCDKGRSVFKRITNENRVKQPLSKDRGLQEAGIREALSGAAAGLKKIQEQDGPGALVGVGSSQATNEENFLLRQLIKSFGEASHLTLDDRNCEDTLEDGILFRADPNPNTHGAKEILGAAEGWMPFEQFLSSVKEKKIKAALVLDYGLARLSEEEVKDLSNLEYLVVISSMKDTISEQADVVMPCAVFAEVDGTFTSFDGRVQPLRQAVPTSQGVKPGWEILCQLADVSKITDVRYSSARGVFDALCREVPFFAGKSWNSPEILVAGPEYIKMGGLKPWQTWSFR